MPSYKAPIRDMQFVIHELWDINKFCQSLPAFAETDAELIDSVIAEAAKVTENILQPINQQGDAEGCHFNDGKVTTPKGFKEAYQQFIEGGWVSLYADPQYGGQGLPKALQVLLDEMICSSNLSFSLYTVLTQGASYALSLHGADKLKQTYLPNLVSGKWSGTMCLTESHCGTDLGMLRTKAVPQNDGTYKISGTKIFITSGEHDLTENIIHTVIARTPDAPEGIKGISLFLVPKFIVNDEGNLGDPNRVSCGSIEHKMGIRASSTCVINFDNATGYLLGELNHGMRAMFSMMNLERLNIGLEGLGLGEVAYQNALNYAKERLQGRAPGGAKFPDKPADPLLVHPDVRRMLLTMKAYNEAARALIIWVAMQIDIAKHDSDADKRQQASNMVALLTPVIKAFYTDYGFEVCNLGLQVLGGHGYVKEWGMEQFVRDARIAQIYEGTNGVQALDLTKRKLIANHGDYLNQLSELISEFTSQHSGNEHDILCEFIHPLEEALQILVDVSYWIIKNAKQNPAEGAAAATDYLRLLGLVCFAFMWAKMAKVALKNKDKADGGFYKSKIHTARFYFRRILPSVMALKKSIQSGSGVLMAMEEAQF